MEVLKLSAREISYIALFESMTGAVVKDCVVDENDSRVTFIVRKGDMGIAIGRRGVNVQRVAKAIGKKVEVIEHSSDPAEFVVNVLRPVKVESVEVDAEKKQIRVRLNMHERERLKRKMLERVREIVRRHHDMDVVIT
ncbi:MAG: NusA-like transcription termination signal-binding factor [Euryarchaeota archaeon]|nr:NusA-like transcription termination signal-binding factor [Euryarchaeota archaeon]